MIKIDRYDCRKCGAVYITRQRVAGIAPTAFRCYVPHCGGIAKQGGDIPMGAIPTHEFCRMSRAEARRLDRVHSGIFKFHKAGGLGLRKINGSSQKES